MHATVISCNLRNKENTTPKNILYDLFYYIAAKSYARPGVQGCPLRFSRYPDLSPSIPLYSTLISKPVANCHAWLPQLKSLSLIFSRMGLAYGQYEGRFQTMSDKSITICSTSRRGISYTNCQTWVIQTFIHLRVGKLLSFVLLSDFYRCVAQPRQYHSMIYSLRSCINVL